MRKAEILRWEHGKRELRDIIRPLVDSFEQDTESDESHLKFVNALATLLRSFGTKLMDARRLKPNACEVNIELSDGSSVKIEVAGRKKSNQWTPSPTDEAVRSDIGDLLHQRMAYTADADIRSANSALDNARPSRIPKIIASNGTAPRDAESARLLKLRTCMLPEEARTSNSISQLALR